MNTREWSDPVTVLEGLGFDPVRPPAPARWIAETIAAREPVEPLFHPHQVELLELGCDGLMIDPDWIEAWILEPDWWTCRPQAWRVANLANVDRARPITMSWANNLADWSMVQGELADVEAALADWSALLDKGVDVGAWIEVVPGPNDDPPWFAWGRDDFVFFEIPWWAWQRWTDWRLY